MNYSDTNRDDEMSMEDILSSIRKYVAEEGEKNAPQHLMPQTQQTERPSEETISPSISEPVIRLSESNIVSEDMPNEQVSAVPQKASYEDKATYQERSSLSMSVTSGETSSQKSDNIISKAKRPGPFDQLTKALNSYGRKKDVEQAKPTGVTVDQLFSTIAERIIQKWVDDHMNEIVEKLVMNEIEKMKSEE